MKILVATFEFPDGCNVQFNGDMISIRRNRKALAQFSNPWADSGEEDRCLAQRRQWKPNATDAMFLLKRTLKKGRASG